MRRSKKVVLIIIFAMATFSCSTKRSVNKLHWLEGTWENITEEGVLYEYWTIFENEEMNGRTFYFEGDSSVTLEYISLKSINDTLFYIPTVFGQNEDAPIPFYTTKLTRKTALFENPDHDFPQKIRYTRVEKDKLIVELSALSGDHIDYMNFSFKKTD